MDAHSEIEHRRAARQEDRVALGREHKQLGRAASIGIQPASAVGPPERAAGRRDDASQIGQEPIAVVALHRRGDDPDIDGRGAPAVLVGILDRGADGLVAVLARAADIVAELRAHHRVGAVDRAQRQVAIGDAFNLDRGRVGPGEGATQILQPIVEHLIQAPGGTQHLGGDALALEQSLDLLAKGLKELAARRLRQIERGASVLRQVRVGQPRARVEQHATRFPHAEPGARARRRSRWSWR